MKRIVRRTFFAFLIGAAFFLLGKDFLDRKVAQEQRESGSGAQLLLADGWMDVEKLANQDKTARVVNSEIFFLLTGLDQNEGVSSETTRSDTMMLIKVNFDQSTVDIISLPRDSRVPVQGEYTKLNHAHSFGGVDLTIETLRDWLQIDLDYYVEVSFEAVKQIVDAMGGIEYTLPGTTPYEYWQIDGTRAVLQPGRQILNGEQALGYLRYRQGYAEGDMGRVRAQQAFLKVFVQEALSAKNIGHIPEFVKTYFDTVHTNIPLDDLIGMAQQATAMKDVKITTHILPGTPQYLGDVSYYLLDWEKTHELISTVLSNYVLLGDAVKALPPDEERLRLEQEAQGGDGFDSAPADGEDGAPGLEEEGGIGADAPSASEQNEGREGGAEEPAQQEEAPGAGEAVSSAEE
ncbi:MAG: LCP family protein [Ndongobacter sp.]|nr:LCP family protein [Ndongobacter sp.]